MPDGYLNSVNLNIGTGFPYLCMDIENGKSVPEPPGFQVMHWHEDLQFIYVFAGELYLHTLDRSAIVPAGRGIFLNKNVVHLVVADPACHYKSFVFPEQLVSFSPGSPAAAYVKRITGCEQLSFLPLSPDIPWQQDILEQLRGLSRLEEGRPDCYEYEVLVRLAAIWLSLAKHTGAPDRPAGNETLRRMRIFLQYIEQHYGEDVTLEALAKSAHVSKSECLRCFRMTVQDTPYRYLTEYRLQRAADLLTGTELPVSQVALAVGFRSQSHFGELFRERTGVTPKKYRKNAEWRTPTMENKTQLRPLPGRGPVEHMPSQIDLHMHSTASDGTDSPVRLAEKVKAAGIRVFALTDHDTVAGVEELMKKPPQGVTFIPGVEFSCRMDTGKCHILGYRCDMTHPAFRDALARGAALRRAKLEKRIDFLRESGMRFPEDELDRLRRIPGVGKPHLGNLMVQYGYAPDKQTAITEVINRCATKSSRICAETAVKAILSSGGVPVWAHPLGGEGEKEIGPEQFARMLGELTGYGLMGLECWYSKYSRTVCERLAGAAREHRLLISGGSDYHGTNKAVALGSLNAGGREVPLEQITLLGAFT